MEEGTARRFELKKAARDLPKVNRMLAKKMLLSQERDREARRRNGEPDDDDNDEAATADAAAKSAKTAVHWRGGTGLGGKQR